MLTYVVIGLVAGSIVSCWQSFKDPPWEGFHPDRFARSLVVGVMLGALAYGMMQRGLIAVDNLGMLALAVLATERLVGETYKGFLRPGPHPEYFHLFRRLGIPVERGVAKFVIGALFLVGGLALYWWFGRLGAKIIDTFGHTILGGLIVGVAAGTMVAVGGAMKDSQFEGFKPLKFIRSPFMAGVGTIFLVRLSDNPHLISIGAIGLERVVVEFYKTFLTRQVRGIHGKKPIAHPEWLERRWIFAVGFLTAVGACVVLLVRRA
jgi:hypothetical protein